jgi:outer membrane protein
MIGESQMKSLFAGLALVSVLCVAGQSVADDFTPKSAGTWIVAGRITDVAPDASGQIRTAAGAATGLSVNVKSDVMPTLGFTYFVSDHFAVEAILGTTKHEISAVGPAGSTKVHENWVLPPVIAAQYHFAPGARISPYIGAGLNAMVFYGGKDANGFKVRLDNGIGYAVQTGVDIALSGPWSANFDVKKVFYKIDASINGSTLNSKVTLDPWVTSIGIARRF